MKKLAVFDFDGTITKKDSFNELIIFQAGKIKFWVGMLKNMPTIISYLRKKTTNAKMKECLFNYFFRNLTKTEYQQLAYDFANQRLPELIRPNMQKIIKKHQKEHTRLVILSASFEDWLIPWATANGFQDVICTEYSFRSNQKGITIFENKSCYGKNKVKMLKEKFPNWSEYKTYAYGDGKSDYPFMKEATEAFIVGKEVTQWSPPKKPQ